MATRRPKPPPPKPRKPPPAKPPRKPPPPKPPWKPPPPKPPRKPPPPKPPLNAKAGSLATIAAPSTAVASNTAKRFIPVSFQILRPVHTNERSCFSAIYGPTDSQRRNTGLAKSVPDISVQGTGLASGKRPGSDACVERVPNFGRASGQEM